MRLVTKRAAHSMASLAAMAVGKIALIWLIVATLGAAVQGEFTYLLSLLIAFGLFGTFGGEIANGYFISQSDVQNESLLKNNIRLISVSIPILCAAAAFLVWVTSPFPSAHKTEPLFLLLLALSLQIISLLLQGFCVGLGRFHEVMVGNLVHYGLSCIAVILLPFSSLSAIVIVLMAWVAGLLAKTAWLLGSVYPMLTLDNKADGVPIALASHLRFGGSVVLVNLANLVNFRFDALLLAYFVPAKDLGYYSLGLMLSESLLYLPKALGQALFSLTAGGRPDSRHNRYIFISIAVTLFSGIVLATGAPWILEKAFGVPPGAAITSARLLCIAAALLGIGQVLVFLAYGKGIPRVAAKISIATALLNIGLTLIFVPKCGLLGAAFASLASYSLYGIALMIVAANHWGVRLGVVH